LFFVGNSSKGVCPRGGEHDGTGSLDYVAHDERDGRSHAQSGWRWCRKCQGMAFSEHGAGHCPAGGGHDMSASDRYVALVEPNLGQTGWRWCRKCQGMHYAGASGRGSCPAGGEHDVASSGPYVVEFLDVVKLDFQPSRHGFHFKNDFVNHVAGITTSGLCGGMSLAAARYWLHHVPIPRQTTADFPNSKPPGVPPDGSVLHNYIYSCQMASYGPLGPVSAANWITMPWITLDCQFDWSVQEFAKVRLRINEGKLTVLGLRTRVSGDPMGHQVLAYGYDANQGKVFIYDSNCPNDDGKFLRLDHATRRIEYDGKEDKWASFFDTGCPVEGGPPPS
jgi:hypothetical protein